MRRETDPLSRDERRRKTGNKRTAPLYPRSRTSEMDLAIPPRILSAAGKSSTCMASKRRDFETDHMANGRRAFANRHPSNLHIRKKRLRAPSRFPTIVHRNSAVRRCIAHAEVVATSSCDHFFMLEASTHRKRRIAAEPGRRPPPESKSTFRLPVRMRNRERPRPASRTATFHRKIRSRKDYARDPKRNHWAPDA